MTAENITDTVNGNYSASYQYDAVGNRIGSTINGVSTLYTVDDNDRLSQQGGETFTYDDNGNTLTKAIDADITAYSYNVKDELVQADVTEQGVNTVSSYQYNVDGIRSQKVVGGETINFLTDANRAYAQMVRETNSTTGDITDYLYGDDLIKQTKAANDSYYLYDGLGSTRALTNSAGAITDTYHFDAFGIKLNQTGTTPNNYLFTGEQFDHALGMTYLRARYYDSSIGRFNQMDTWMGNNSDPVTLHKYLYAGNDPVLNIDPSGNSYLLGQLGSVSIMRALATISVAAVGISSVDLTLDSNATDGGFSGVQESYILLAAMSGAGSKILDLITSKLSENSEGRVVMFHGSSVASLVSLLNGAPLSAATALNSKFPGEQSEIGFYLTPDLLAVEFFGGRRGGGVIQFAFTNAAFQAVKLGSKTQPIPPLGSSSQSLGIEMVVRPIIFPLFDSLRTSGQITASPVN